MEARSEEIASFEKDLARRRAGGEERATKEENRTASAKREEAVNFAEQWEKRKAGMANGIVRAVSDQNVGSLTDAMEKAVAEQVPYLDLLPEVKIGTWERAQFISFARQGHVLAVRTLLALKVSPDARDHFGDSALHIAAENADIEVTFWLLRHQADVNIRNKVGETSLTVALLRRHNQVQYLLRQALISSQIPENAMDGCFDFPKVGESLLLDLGPQKKRKPA